MPCCGVQLCWVNPRLPTYCPECNARVLRELKFAGEHTVIFDEAAWLTYDNGLPEREKPAPEKPEREKEPT